MSRDRDAAGPDERRDVTSQDPLGNTIGRVAGKVAFVTGAARGQGRAHAIRLAEEGADIIALDLCRQIDSVPYPMAGQADLAETVAAVERLDRRAVGVTADVRDLGALQAGLDGAVSQLGRLDIVCANAGIVSYGMSDELTSQAWRDVLDVNLTGVWHTVRAATGHLITTGAGGTIILTSSVAGLKGLPAMAHYVSAKHGVIGLMRTLALELGVHGIRVNAVLPTTVCTPMVENEGFYRLLFPDIEHPTSADFAARPGMSILDIPYVEPIDVSNAVLFLASGEARYVNAVALPVDGGMLAR
jgi:(+)-trans-carveol dehydrogenase